MTNFELYARYYDLLYSDKDYAGEASYVEKLLGQHAGKKVRSILNLGCGTGKHDLLLAERGYDLHGVDLSADMIDVAAKASIAKKLENKVSFAKGDARTYRSDQQYDAVISLFHVASYQTGNDDITNFFNTAAHHLAGGSLFIFDCWYGPAVLSDPPVVRVKRLKDERITITRIAEPVIHPNRNVVDVNYEVSTFDSNTAGFLGTIREQHPMRYFFYPEIQAFLQSSQFDIITFEEWLTGKTPDLNSWNVVFICKRK